MLHHLEFDLVLEGIKSDDPEEARRMRTPVSEGIFFYSFALQTADI